MLMGSAAVGTVVFMGWSGGSGSGRSRTTCAFLLEPDHTTHDGCGESRSAGGGG